MNIKILNVSFFAIMLVLILPTNLQARDDRLKFSIDEVMKRAISEGMIDGSVKFYWGESKHSKIKTNFGEVTTSGKTNAFNKSDKEACDWAMLGAIKKFHRKAKLLGANAIINIQSNYKHEAVSSTDKYECGAGTFLAGVALKADFVAI